MRFRFLRLLCLLMFMLCVWSVKSTWGVEPKDMSDAAVWFGSWLALVVFGIILTHDEHEGE
jgi:hypothetical protein